MDSGVGEMKRLFVFLIMSLVCLSVFATAPDRRISDDDGDVLDITSSGGFSMSNPTLAGGTVTITATGTAIVIGTGACKRVVLKAALANSGDIYLGGSDVIATIQNGFPLDAGDEWIGTVDNLSDIYIDALISSDTVSYTYENW